MSCAIRRALLRWRGSVLKRLRVKIVNTPYRVKMHARWRDATFRYIAKGLYGFQYSDYLSSIQKPFVFLDIGANQGLYSLISVKNSHCILAYAFEPVAQTFGWLSENRNLSPYAHKLVAHQVAVGDVDGFMHITLGDSHSGVASLRQSQTAIDRKMNTERIECISAKSLSALIGELNDASLVVKIDVEGFEPRVIESLMTSDLKSVITSMYFEVDETWWDPAEIFAMLDRKGFQRILVNVGSEAHHYDVLYSRHSDSVSHP